MDFSEKIRQIRQALDLSQKSFAEKCGISLGAVRHYEQGRSKPGTDAIEKICAAFPNHSNILFTHNAFDNAENTEKQLDTEFERLIAKMDESQLDDVLKYMRFVASKD